MTINDLKLPPVQIVEGDFVDASGVTYCGVCRCPKSEWVKELGVFFPTPCECEAEKLKAQQNDFDEQARQAKVDSLVQKAFPAQAIKSFRKSNFAADLFAQSNESRVCRRYVDRWRKMTESNVGILLAGGVGVGKTFYSLCVANALLGNGVYVKFRTISEIINDIQTDFNASAIIEELCAADLLIIDDLGTERTTDFGYEQTERLIDTRYTTKKPVIITTNLTIGDLKNPRDIRTARIYDRVLEMCPVRVVITGESKRKLIAERQANLAKEILA